MRFKTKIIIGLVFLIAIIGTFYFPQFDGFQLKGVADNLHKICYPIK